MVSASRGAAHRSVAPAAGDMCKTASSFTQAIGMAATTAGRSTFAKATAPTTAISRRTTTPIRGVTSAARSWGLHWRFRIYGKRRLPLVPHRYRAILGPRQTRFHAVAAIIDLGGLGGSTHRR